MNFSVCHFSAKDQLTIVSIRGKSLLSLGSHLKCIIMSVQELEKIFQQKIDQEIKIEPKD